MFLCKSAEELYEAISSRKECEKFISEQHIIIYISSPSLCMLFKAIDTLKQVRGHLLRGHIISFNFPLNLVRSFLATKTLFDANKLGTETLQCTHL